MKSFAVTVPATTANLGPGFDAIGLALKLENRFEFRSGVDESRCSFSGEGADVLGGIDPEKNLLLQAFRRYYGELGESAPEIGVTVRNAVPLARGLGSSATAVVAGLLAADRLSEGRLASEAVFRLACKIEGHADNVAPALYGGLNVSLQAAGESGKAMRLRLDPPADLHVVTAVPDFSLKTERARQVLPDRVPFEDAVFNVGRVSLMVAAVCRGDLEAFGAAMDDRLHQPYRKELVPGFSRVVEQAKTAGALGAALSGAGPTVAAFVEAGDAVENRVAAAMVEAFRRDGVEASARVLAPSLKGAVVDGAAYGPAGS